MSNNGGIMIHIGIGSQVGPQSPFRQGMQGLAAGGRPLTNSISNKLSGYNILFTFSFENNVDVIAITT